ncbi:MAG: TIR domain-containing protein [Candidatus Hodarchaeota archaeon]
MNEKIQSKIFLSHSNKDKKFVKELVNRLTNDGFSVWYDDWEIKIGDSIINKINEGISTSDFLIIVLSKNSVNSKWVKEELNAATIKNIESKGIFILPILISECKIPPLLTDKKYADFSLDPDDAYEKLVTSIKHNLEKSEDYLRNVRSKIGIESQKKGRTFEERVAELYRLLHYKVNHGRIFSGRQVDIFLIGKFGDLTIHRAIECKSGEVFTSHIDNFLTKLRLVQKEFPSAQGTIVSGTSFSDAVISNAAALGIQLITYRDLEAQLFDGFSYAKSLINECEMNSRYPIDLYIDQFIGYDTKSDDIPAMDFLDDWLKDETWNQLTLLGDLGTGKTFLTRMFAYMLAIKFLESPLDNPLPIRIDLRKAEREFSLEGMILTHLTRSGLSEVTFDVFQYSLSEGNIILIFDGFDEMSSRVSPLISRKNFNELAKCVSGRSKILLTCRTHYFKSKTEEEEIILGNRKEYESGDVRDLYWELISRKGFRIAYLRPFTISQISKFVKLVLPTTAEEAMNKIRNTYNLLELSQRPLLLDMVVKSLDKIKSKKINISTLYEIFTDAWIHREQWREIISPKTKIQFLNDLSFSLWQEETSTVHHTKLLNYIQKELAQQIFNPQEFLELDNEIRTASFLTRDEFGNYGFAHKSFAEFFLACHIAQELNRGNWECLRIRRITIEIIGFLKNMIDFSKIEPMLKQILLKTYSPQVSENVLICYYSFLREKLIFQNEEPALKVHLPDRVQLEDAQLEQIVLENVEMNYAKLNRAQLSEAILVGANLHGCELNSAIMKKIDLNSANLSNAMLSKANLYSANLESADLSCANLSNSNLTGAILSKAILKDTDLTSVIANDVFLSEKDIERFAFEIGSKEKVYNIFKKQQLARSKDDNEFIKNIIPDIYDVAQLASLRLGIDTDEIISELMFKVCDPRTLKRLKESKKSVRSYLLSSAKSIAHKYSIDEDRSKGPFISLETPVLDGTLSDILGYSEEPNIFKKEIWEIIENKLSDDITRILKKRFIEELTIAEISEQEKIPEIEIHRKIGKAFEILRVELSDFCEYT